MNYYLQGLKEWKDFKGKVTRKEFFMYGFGVCIITIIALILSAVAPKIGMVISTISYIVHIIPSLSITTRRLHDINKSGWWQLITVIPLIGAIWLIILICKPSIKNTNNEVM